MAEKPFTRLELTDSYGRQVVIQLAYVDLDAKTFINDLFRPAMLAWGFVEATVEEFLGQP